MDSGRSLLSEELETKMPTGITTCLIMLLFGRLPTAPIGLFWSWIHMQYNCPAEGLMERDFIYRRIAGPILNIVRTRFARHRIAYNNIPAGILC